LVSEVPPSESAARGPKSPGLPMATPLTSLHNVPLSLLLPNCQLVFKKSFHFVATSHYAHYVTSGVQQEG